jgi:hypothetical protein
MEKKKKIKLIKERRQSAINHCNNKEVDRKW